MAALKLNTTLRELFLAENKISPADGFQLGNLLRTNTHLELLDLSNNKLGVSINFKYHLIFFLKSLLPFLIFVVIAIFALWMIMDDNCKLFLSQKNSPK